MLLSCHPSAQTLGSRKLNFTPGNKNWIPASRAGMTAVLRHTAIHSRYLSR
ncbi:hypothetical protein [Wolbachia pipientis]|uniref:hypothetical protein n=1 Tax=Wolbachia pipientis TaxID=955 RepID=UPI0015CFB142|nr:hypothetical protein [Wolbachia pipientis]